jgi:hypothetical protein
MHGLHKIAPVSLSLTASIYRAHKLAYVPSLLFYTPWSTHRLLDINVTKNVHSTLQQIDPARNLKNGKSRFTRDVLLLFCMFALGKDERRKKTSVQ